MAKKKSFKVGNKVSWDSEAGHVSGSIKKIHTKPFKLYGKDGTAYTRHASKEDPVYEIKSNKSDHVAYHYGKALYKAQAGLQIKPSFEEYYKTVPQYKNDTSNYNLREAYNNLPYKLMEEFSNNPETHLPDTYKLPSHPTFSKESIYFNPSTNKDSAGYWLENMYIPYNPKYRDTVIEKNNGGALQTAQSGVKLKNQFVEPDIQNRLEALYNPIHTKILNAVGNEDTFFSLPVLNQNILDATQPQYGGKYLDLTQSGKARNPPPMDPILKEMQERVMELPDKEIQRLLKVNYEGLSIPEALSIKPKNVSYLDALKYVMHIRKLNKQGYTFQEGGGIPAAITPQEQYIGLNNPNYTEMYFPNNGINTFRGLDNGQPVQLIDETGNTKILYGPDDQTIMKGNVMEKKAKSGIKINPKNKGKFNATKKRTGKSTEELTHSKNPLTRKRAIFAQNASHWRKGEDGLDIQPLQGQIQANFPNIQNIQVPAHIDPNHNLPISSPVNNVLSNPPIFNTPSPVEGAATALSLADYLIPNNNYRPLNVIPIENEEHPQGTGSHALYQAGGEVPKKQLTDQEIFDDYNRQFKDNPDGGRLATIMYLSTKYNVPPSSVFSTSNHAWDPTQQNSSGQVRNRTYQIIQEGKAPMTFTQPIGGVAVGASPSGTPQTQTTLPIARPIALKNNGGGLSRDKDYKSKKKPYPSVDSSDFAGPNRTYPIPTESDAVDALRLAGMHHAHSVIAKVYDKYPKLKHDKKKGNNGLNLPDNNQLQFTYGGGAKVISDNPYSNSPTLEFVGPSHEKGGIGIQYGSSPAEVEGDETAYVDNTGDMNIMGNMRVPGMNKKFKNVMKDISKEENKVSSIISKGKEADAKYTNDHTKFGNIGTNTAMLMQLGGDMKMQKLNAKKEALKDIQNHMLNISQVLNIDPQAMSYGKIKKAKSDSNKAQAGKRLMPEELENYMKSFGKVESSNNYFIPASSGTAYGRYQFTKGTRDGIYKANKGAFKAAGIDSLDQFEKAFKSNPQIQDQVMSLHLNHLYQKYDGNPQYIALAHRLGEGSADSLINKGYYTLNGEKKGWDDPITASVTGKETPTDYVKKVTTIIPPDQSVPTSIPTLPQEPTLPNIPLAKIPNIDIPVERINSVDPGLKPTPATPSPTNPSPYRPFQPQSYEPTPLSISEVAPELYALATNTEQGVQGQSYTPRLYQPYQISLQDQLNQNESTFRGLEQQLSESPEALSTLAARKYQADEGVLGNEFRTNQQIGNQVSNENINLLNRANLTNLQLGDTQYTRQAQAHANTIDRNNQILNSLASKVNQNVLENKTLATYQNLFPYYRMQDINNDGIKDDMQYIGPDAKQTMSNFSNGGKMKRKGKNKSPNSEVIRLIK